MDIQDILYEIQTTANRSLVYEDMVIANKSIPLVLLGDNGIFIFFVINHEDTRILEKNIRNVLGYTGSALFMFGFDDTGCSFFNGGITYLIEDNILSRIQDFYQNTQMPYTTLIQNGMHNYTDMFREIKVLESDEEQYTGNPEYIKILIPEYVVESIRDNIKKLKINDSGIWIDEQGTRYVQKRDTSGFYFSGEMKKYKLSDKNADRVFILTVLGGWFGLHRYQEGDILNGLFYSLTCGIFGVGNVMDLLLMLMGRRSYIEVNVNDHIPGALMFTKSKIYYDKISDKKKGLLGMIIAVIISFVLTNTFYKWLYETIVQVIISIAQSLQ